MKKLKLLSILCLTFLLLGCDEEVNQAYMNPRHLQMNSSDTPEVVSFKKMALESRRQGMQKLTTIRQKEMFDAMAYRRESEKLEEIRSRERDQLAGYPISRPSHRPESALVRIDSPNGSGIFIPDGKGGGEYFGPGYSRATIISDGMGGGSVIGPGNERGAFVADGLGSGTYFGSGNSTSTVVSDGAGGGTIFGPGTSRTTFTANSSTVSIIP